MLPRLLTIPLMVCSLVPEGGLSSDPRYDHVLGESNATTHLSPGCCSSISCTSIDAYVTPG